MYEYLNALISPQVIAGITLTILVQLIFKHFPPAVKSYFRGSRLKELKKIKSIRHNQDSVTYESIKSGSYFLLFMGACTAALIIGTVGPLFPISKAPAWSQVLLFTPIVITEIMWLNQSANAQHLIKCRGKLRVTRRSI